MLSPSIALRNCACILFCHWCRCARFWSVVAGACDPMCGVAGTVDDPMRGVAGTDGRRGRNGPSDGEAL